MRNCFVKIIGILFLVTCLAFEGEGQVPYFQYYSLLKKNEPVQVNAILQGKFGFMWFGTTKGLFKFDGTKFTRFTSAENLPDDNVTALGVDSIGRIWTGHKNGQLAFIENGVVKRFNPQEGNATQEISDILFDRKGNLWFATLNDGLYFFRNERLYRLDETDGMPDLFVYDILEDRSGNIWAGTDGGVAVCSLVDSKVTIKTYNYINGLPDNIIKKIEQDEKGSMWMATEDKGIIHYDSASATYKPLIEGKWNFGVVSDFIIDEYQVWISCLQTGLVVYNRKTAEVKRYNSMSGPGFSSFQVLTADREKNIWAGSKMGLMRTQGDHIEFIRTPELNNDNIIAVAIDQKGNNWFSTDEGLFKRTVDETGKVSLEKPLSNSKFQKFTVISLYVDSFGYIWAGLYGEGVLRINPITGTIHSLTSEIRNGNVLNITGKGDVVWLATLGGGTQIKISGDKLSIKNFTSQDGLVSDYIYQVFIDSKSRVWFATDGKGVDMMDDKGFHHYQEGLNSKVVYGFAEDGDHRIWVNVQGEGLYQFSENKFTAFDLKGTRLRDNNVGSFTSTASGNLFIIHDLGVDIYDIKRDRVEYHGEEVGIRDMKPNLNSIAKDKYGGIFIGTDNGIIKYVDFFMSYAIEPTPFIESFNVVNQPVSLQSELSFPYDKNDVTILFRGLWFQDPAALVYQYRLKNFDKEWISTRDQSVTYSSLPPGEYEFQLKISNDDGFVGAPETHVSFTIRSPFWRTSWFYTLSVLVIVFGVYIIIKFRERKLRRDKQFLEASVIERTLEIIKKNDEINTQAEEIRAINENLEQLVKERTSQLERKNKALEEYAFINAHELRAPVASILGLINLMETIELDEEHRIYIKHLQSSAEKLDSVVRSIGKAIEKGE